MQDDRVAQLNKELESAITNLSDYHRDMLMHGDYYRYSAFFGRQAGQAADYKRLPDNFLKVFADKNIHYSSEMPEFKVMGSPEDRDNANIREKVLYGVHRKSGTRLLQKLWARDKTIRSMAIAETTFDLQNRCVRVKRYDPRRVYWKTSNANEQRVNVFWAVYPITATEAQQRYGVTPEKDYLSMSITEQVDPYIGKMDGQTWFTMAIRWDSKTRVAWIGDKMIEEQHEHFMGEIPIDIDVPFPSDRVDRFGEFYLEPLVPLQAELNSNILERSKIVKRMSNPIFWASNMKSKTYDEVKAALKNGDSGMIGLAKDGQVGLLQLQELQMLDNHIDGLIAHMQRLSGFAAASFGESVGANTSGDALGMYFTPTQKHVDDQNINQIMFYESINAKILKLYDVFGRTGETFSLDGYSPRSTITASDEQGDYSMNSGGGYNIQFDRTAISGNYVSRAIPPSVIPRNDLAEKQFWVKAAQDKIISRTTAYEKIGLESPEDEKDLLEIEQADPLLNPQGTQQMMQGALAAGQLTNPQPALPAATPQTPNGV